MSDILWFFFGFLLGIFVGANKKEKLPIVEILSNQVQELERQLAYYKDLCKWHVEEKRKAQEIRDKFERESG